jgi:sugar phosphate isomerase/epimerase
VARSGSPGVGLDAYTIAEHVRVGGTLDGVAAMLRARGLVCTDVGALLLAEDDTLEAARALADLAAATRAGVCIAAVSSPKPRAQVVDDLGRCTEMLAEGGTRLALEFTSYGGLLGLEDSIDLCETVGRGCGVLVDSLHFFRTGAPWDTLRSLAADRIALVHIDDVPERATTDVVLESRFGRVPPGSGVLPLGEFRAALDGAGYDGVVSAEVLSTRLRALPPEEGARELVDALRRTWPIS